MTYEAELEKALELDRMNLDAQRDRMREALETIAHMGISQPVALNEPDADWYRRLFSHFQRIAREALRGTETV